MKEGGFNAVPGRPLDLAYWDSRYRSGATSWDLGEVSPPIKSYVHQLKNKDIDILIPGCGNAHEAEFLAKQGFQKVVLLDISPTLVQKLKKRFASMPNVEVLQGDFFDFQGKYDLILEQTFFCALPPYRRQDYMRKMEELLKPEGKLVGLLFNRTFEEQGPPFGGSINEYETLMARHFRIKTLKACHNSHPARSGTEVFFHCVRRED